MDPLVSIIIPVYNVEKYLDKCIASVVNQTYTNLEIILVDDGSPDNCPAICNEWQAKDNRIKVIHQENGGLSKARNEGLKIATGEFIGFVDSDDWIEPEMYETLLTALLESKADIAVCNYQVEYEKIKNTIPSTKTKDIRHYTAEEVLKLIFTIRGFIRTVVWNKLYKRILLVNNLFPEGKIYEDNYWTPKVIGGATLILTIDSSFYHYLYREKSLSHDICNLYQRLLNKFEMVEKRIKYIHEYYPSLENLAIVCYQSYCYQKYIEVSLKCNQLDRNGIIRRMIHDNFCKWSWYKNIILGNYRFGIVYLLFRYFPSLIPLISSIYQK